MVAACNATRPRDRAVGVTLVLSSVAPLSGRFLPCELREHERPAQRKRPNFKQQHVELTSR